MQHPILPTCFILLRLQNFLNMVFLIIYKLFFLLTQETMLLNHTK